MSRDGHGSPASLSARIADHLRGNVVGYLALLIALSGTAWAANKVTSHQIARNAVRAKHIKDGEVSSADVADDSLTGTDVDEASLQIDRTDDDTTYSPSPDGGLSLSGTEFALKQCPGGQVLKSAGGNWNCAADADSPPGPGSITSAEIANGAITDGDISPGAAISSSKLAGQMGVYTGQVAGLPSVAFASLDASASGITDGSTFPTASSVATLSPATTLTASALSVQLDSPPGLGNAWNFSLIADSNLVLFCSIANSDTTCDSGSTTAVIPPGARLWMNLFSQGAGTIGGGRALFGWEVR